MSRCWCRRSSRRHRLPVQQSTHPDHHRHHRLLRVRQKTSRPTAATTTTELQTLLDTFVDIYNHHRPHRSLPHRATPAAIYTTRPKATPGDHEPPDTEFRVRHDRVHKARRAILRHNGQLHHIGIGIGRPHAGTPIVMLINGVDIRIIHAATTEIIRQLTLDPTRTYHGTGNPIGGPSRPYGPRKTKRSEPR